MKQDSSNVNRKRWENIALAMPVWLPVVYVLAVKLELIFTKHGLLNEGGLGALLIFPIIPIYFILTSEEVPLFGKILAVPAYYAVGVFIAGIEGWMICDWLHVCH